MERMWMVVLCVLVAAVSASASPIVVEKPKDSATVFVQFKDGASFEFEVFFDAPQEEETVTGLDLIGWVGEQTPLEIAYGYGGGYVDGMSYDSDQDGTPEHENAGYVAPDDWWHYYTAEEGDTDWTSSMVGAGGRTVVDGSMDAWVYGSPNPPSTIPEPMTMALLSIGGLAVLTRKRNRS